jgi:hypothetical protein
MIVNHYANDRNMKKWQGENEKLKMKKEKWGDGMIGCKL